MPESPARGLPPVGIEFGSVEWQEEVGRLHPFSPARARAENARKAIETGTIDLAWKRCKAEGPGGTRLPGCASCTSRSARTRPRRRRTGSSSSSW